MAIAPRLGSNAFMSESAPVYTILQVLPRLESGGVERGTIEITQAIVTAGMRALVASNGGALEPMIARAGGKHIKLPLHSKNPFMIWRNALSLARLIRDEKIDLVHARSRAPAWSAYLACRRTHTKFITTFHGIYSRKTKWKQRYNSVMVLGEKIIAVSGYVKEHVLQHYHVAEDRVVRIDRGVDFKLFTPDKIVADRMALLTREWRLPDDDVRVILVPGRISRIKGHHVVLKALAAMRHQRFICVFLGNAAGHEHYVAQLNALMSELKLEGRIRIVPHTPYMAEALALSDIVLMPSLKPESFGRVAVEAQAMGKLVIASDHGGARETIVPNETGYLVEPGNVHMLAAAMDYALERDEATKAAMAEFAVQHVRAHFSIARMKNATIRLYRELLGGASPLEEKGEIRTPAREERSDSDQASAADPSTPLKISA